MKNKIAKFISAMLIATFALQNLALGQTKGEAVLTGVRTSLNPLSPSLRLHRTLYYSWRIRLWRKKWQMVDVIAGYLRPSAFGDRRYGALKLTQDKAEFKMMVEQWLEQNEFSARYGRWPLLLNGSIKINNNHGHLTAVIMSQDWETGHHLEIASQYGIECFMGSYFLCRALKNAGYATKIMMGEVGIWNEHCYIEAKVGADWIRVSTAPDVAHFDFVAANEKQMGDSEADINFKALTTVSSLSDQISPMTYFVSGEGQKVVVCAGMAFDEEAPKEVPQHMRAVTFICYSLIYRGQEVERIVFAVHTPLNMLSLLRRIVVRQVSDAGRDRTIGMLSQISKDESMFVVVDMPSLAGQTHEEVAKRSSQLLYDMISRIDVDSLNQTVHELTFLELAERELDGTIRNAIDSGI